MLVAKTILGKPCIKDDEVQTEKMTKYIFPVEVHTAELELRVYGGIRSIPC